MRAHARKSRMAGCATTTRQRAFALSLNMLFAAITAGDLRDVGLYVIALVLSITVHEFSHAFAAHKLGDPTPEREGRLTLNPTSHTDPIGTLLLPVLAALFHLPLFGWGRPVPTQPQLYTRKVSMRGGMALVAAAGPLSNLALALASVLVLKLLALVGLLGAGMLEILQLFLLLNLVLMAFNLLPIHPLDGGKVLAWLLPPRYRHVDDFMIRWGGLILLALVFAFPQVLSLLLRPFYLAANWMITSVVLP